MFLKRIYCFFTGHARPRTFAEYEPYLWFCSRCEAFLFCHDAPKPHRIKVGT